MNIRLGRKQLAVVGLAVAAGAVVAVSASAATNLFADPGRARLGGEVSPQSASSTAGAITLSVSEAIFSGTQTLLRLQATQDGQPLDPAVYSIRPAAVRTSGFAQAQGQEGSQASTGSRLLQLPPVLAPGPVTMTIAELVVRPPGGSASVVPGPWQLTLTGVARSDFANVMRVEALAGGTVDLEGNAVRVTGYRSTSQTIVEYTQVEGLTEIVPPRLSGKGFDRADPYEVGAAGGVRRAAFAPTPFGEEVVVAFGPFSQADASAQRLRISLVDATGQSLLDRGGEVPIEPSQVLSGDATIPVSVEVISQHIPPLPPGMTYVDFGRVNPTGDIKLIRLNLNGTWDPDFSAGNPYANTPGLLDARGVALRMVTAGSGYSKDASGQIREGSSQDSFFLEPDMDMTTVTLILGAPQRVLQGDWQATLRPVK
ncbi:MAG: hypothetical protein IT429_19960 [Gemmataceae bacterium]|nr:hypothetical protein [Gemmataceae bacterium]